MQQIKRNIKLNQQYTEAERYDQNLKSISRNTWWHESKSKYDKVNELKFMNKVQRAIYQFVQLFQRSRKCLLRIEEKKKLHAQRSLRIRSTRMGIRTQIQRISNLQKQIMNYQNIYLSYSNPIYFFNSLWVNEILTKIHFSLDFKSLQICVQSLFYEDVQTIISQFPEMILLKFELPYQIELIIQIKDIQLKLGEQYLLILFLNQDFNGYYISDNLLKKYLMRKNINKSRTYSKISEAQKKKLLNLVCFFGLKIKDAAKQLNIKYAAAKTYMIFHRKNVMMSKHSNNSEQECQIAPLSLKKCKLTIISKIGGEVVKQHQFEYPMIKQG
ncbi:unnamed protein product (macronuclear) [Paramecium tetraurelia]|uniref:Uncharacterized protein n=1 Tax=Paramecium tetraurelia TaxID=5888 RepID=A0E6R4_PARTE|nr:uncharacterized protein GSPATT00023709001 [Paramecium tetraurelia]CAK90981.1 unnamed protein product [Paramecium tetraurelia]|eukprot:XP_001458378.1 hypothetical protein (macronuclear) [Paramecium tetraurelia strain d4-2]